MMEWKDIAVHDEEGIRGFFGEFRWMSNFYLCLIQFDGLIYPAVENAYMAAKTDHKDARVQFRHVAPSEAKRRGREVILRDNWEEIKLDIMYQLNLQKYSNNIELRRALLDTGNKYLEETNYWGDTYWGVCKNQGLNHLGKILMRIRKELKDGY